MQTIIDSIIGTALELFMMVTMAALSLAAAYAVFYIRKAKETLETQTDSQLLRDVLSRAAAIAETVVWSLESTVAKELRKAVKEGRARPEELLAIGERAVRDVLAHLGDEGQKLLADAIGNVEDYVRDLVEAQLEKLKQYPFGSSLSGSGASTQAS